MQESHTVEWRFHVREVGLQQFAALWSAVERALPEVEGWSGQLSLDGELLRHRSAFDDPAALARSSLASRVHLVQTLSLRIASDALCVSVSYDCEKSFKLIPALPDALRVRVSGASDRAVLAVGDVIEDWGRRGLRTRRRALWLNLGAFAAGAAATGWGTALLSGHAVVAGMMVVEWCSCSGSRASFCGGFLPLIAGWCNCASSMRPAPAHSDRAPRTSPLRKPIPGRIPCAHLLTDMRRADREPTRRVGFALELFATVGVGYPRARPAVSTLAIVPDASLPELEDVGWVLLPFAAVLCFASEHLYLAIKVSHDAPAHGLLFPDVHGCLPDLGAGIVSVFGILLAEVATCQGGVRTSRRRHGHRIGLLPLCLSDQQGGSGLHQSGGILRNACRSGLGDGALRRKPFDLNLACADPCSGRRLPRSAKSSQMLSLSLPYSGIRMRVLGENRAGRTRPVRVRLAGRRTPHVVLGHTHLHRQA